jgi:creatinine amidohydrolase
MKPATVFISEMTNRELEQFLGKHTTVLIPTGATEQHGPHSPLSTDVLIPQELCRRVANSIGAVVAPPLSYASSYPHRGFKGEFSLRIDTFMDVITDL